MKALSWVKPGFAGEGVSPLNPIMCLPTSNHLNFFLSILSTNLRIICEQFCTLAAATAAPLFSALLNDTTTKVLQCCIHTLAWTLCAPFPPSFPQRFSSALVAEVRKTLKNASQLLPQALIPGHQLSDSPTPTLLDF